MNKEDIFISLYVQYIYNMYYTDTKQYYSTIKNNQIMPFAATWLDLEIVTLSEVSQRKIKTNMILFICGI